MSVVVVATFFPKPGLKDAVHAVIADVQTKVWEEDGCELYALHETDDKFVLVEKWSSVEALDIHGQTPVLAQLGEDLAPLIAADTEVIRLFPVDGPAHRAAAL